METKVALKEMREIVKGVLNTLDELLEDRLQVGDIVRIDLSEIISKNRLHSTLHNRCGKLLKQIDFPPREKAWETLILDDLGEKRLISESSLRKVEL